MKLFTTLLLIFLSGLTHSQIDHNNYTTLLSRGPIPQDFTDFTYQKLERDLKDPDNSMNSIHKTEFYTGVNYAIDALLHSGLVIYGDPVSEYVTDVAEKLLFDDKELFNELRFYTIKSNATNAFATDQGILFVTTGLLSQITNEAQLALVLSHEIAHYKENDTRESYEYIVKNRKASIENFSIYSKDLELKADRLGLEMYAKAGYSREAIIPTFDVLLYSYLPFDEVQVPNSYFQDFDSLFVPDNLFPTAPYQIEAIEDEDDSRSSHPNVKTRKEEIQAHVDAIKNWKNNNFKLGEERFEEIRTYARFEVVRNNLQEAEYSKTLYAIYLLEQEYPESMFLQRMKAQAWLGMLQYQADYSISKVIPRKSSWEGASANVHHFLKEMNSDQLMTVCVRNIFSLKRAHKEDAEIEAIYDRMLHCISRSSKFKLSEYATISFETAYQRSLPDTTTSTSEEVKSDVKDQKLSKYDRIKKKKSVDVPLLLDSNDFHIYLIPDVINDSVFTTKYTQYEKWYDEWEAAKDTEDFEEKYKNEPVDHIISVQPFVTVKRGGDTKHKKGEKLSFKAHDGIDLAAEKAGIKVTQLDRTTIMEEGTEKFNQYCLLMSYLVQSGNNTDVNSFPVDFQLTQDIQEQLGTSNVMYSSAMRNYDMDFRFTTLLLTVIVYPFLPVYISYLFIDAPKNEVQMVAFDMETGVVLGAMDRQFKSKLRKYNYAAYMYNFFHYLNH